MNKKIYKPDIFEIKQIIIYLNKLNKLNFNYLILIWYQFHNTFQMLYQW